MNVRKLGIAGAVVAMVAALLAVFIPSANAAGAPPWEPDPQALGTVSFYNSAGQLVTSGNDLSNLFSYAKASNNNGPAGTTKAFINWAFPKSGENTGLWFVAGQAIASPYPNANAPAPLNSSTSPLVTATAVNQEANFKAVSGQGTNDPTAGYNNMIQVRLGTIGPGGVGTGSASYWASDIMVNYQNNTWTQVYPTPAAGPTATTTSLSASPASPQSAGTTVTFKATVAPSVAGGTVQFKDGGSDLGSPVAVSGGTASLSTSTLPTGPHSITAAFTPGSPSSYTSSTSSPLSYTITAVAASTSTTLDVTPASPITMGTQSTLKATVTPSSAPGSVQFYDGATKLGSAVPVSGGTATSPAQTFAVNTHQLKAVFTSTSPADFTGSTSNVVTYVVNPQPATQTTTDLSVAPGSPQTYGTSLAFTATVSPATAAGAVNFLDGSTVIGTKPVTGGTATVSTSALSAGSHSLTAVFVPSNANAFGTSSSTVTPFTVSPAASTVSLAAQPSSTAEQGTSVTLTATTGPAGTGGSVEFLDGSTPLGSAKVSAGKATLTTSTLGLGSHSLSASFTPSGGNYKDSTSPTVAYSITAVPASDTTTSLAVTPAGPVARGTKETLTASVTPAAATGTVTFLDGPTQVGPPAAVANGKASISTTLPQGTHSLTAMFLPADPSKYNGSNSGAAPVSYVVLPPAAATTTDLAIAPGASEPYGTAVTFTGKVTPSAAGTVTFRSGSAVLGTKAVTTGSNAATATLTMAGLGGGAYSVTATFTPSAPLYFTSSTSSPAPLTITAVSTTTSLKISPAGPVTQGSRVALTGTITPRTATGTVTFRSGATAVGSAAVSQGVAVLRTTALKTGVDSITASFAATHAKDYKSSTSAPLTIKITPRPVITAVYLHGKAIKSGTAVPQHSSLQVHASRFTAHDRIVVSLHSPVITIGTIRSDASGNASANVVLPSNVALGRHTIVLAGSTGSASFRIFVVRATSTGTTSGSNSGVSGGTSVDSSSSSPLASTGFDIGIGVVSGLVLVGAGLVTLFGSRARARYRGAHR